MKYSIRLKVVTSETDDCVRIIVMISIQPIYVLFIHMHMHKSKQTTDLTAPVASAFSSSVAKIDARNSL